MKKYLIIAIAAVLALGGCKSKEAAEPKVMARAVPERMDDFVFENNLIAGRFYGKALEGNPTCPGVDIWVKMPGKLVADEWYAKATGPDGDSNYYHHNHGDGKDCYKVSVSLGGGSSAILIDGKLEMPATNYRSFDILEQTPEKVVFVLHYPEWTLSDGSTTVSLDKKVTVTADSYFTNVEDTYTSNVGPLTVAAGFFRHPGQDGIESELALGDRAAIWEHASDQSQEAEDGMLGVGVYLPGAENVCVTDDGSHSILTKTVKSGEAVTYCFGSCWSKGGLKTADDWFAVVKAL